MCACHRPLQSYDAQTDTATIAAVTAALTQFRTQNYRVLILYLFMDTALNVFQAMHAAGMFGARYMLFIPPYLQSNILFSSQAVMSVVAGALMIGTFFGAHRGSPSQPVANVFSNHHGNFLTAHYPNVFFCASSIRAKKFHSVFNETNTESYVPQDFCLTPECLTSDSVCLQRRRTRCPAISLSSFRTSTRRRNSRAMATTRV